MHFLLEQNKFREDKIFSEAWSFPRTTPGFVWNACGSDPLPGNENDKDTVNDEAVLGSVTFCCESGSKPLDYLIRIRILFFSDFKDAKIFYFFSKFFFMTHPYFQSFKFNFLRKFCVKILFASINLVRTTPLWEKGRIWIRIYTLTNGPGSWRPKNMRILQIRLGIPNTEIKYAPQG